MNDKLIKCSDIIDLLITEEYLKGSELVKTVKPTHGSCCTCQDCGHDYDECICEHNNLLAKILEL